MRFINVHTLEFLTYYDLLNRFEMWSFNLFSVCFFTCWFSTCLREKSFLQKVHLNLILLCISEWKFKCDACRNDFPQSSHLYGFNFKWTVSICVLTLDLFVKVCWQISQGNFWVASRSRRLLFLLSFSFFFLSFFLLSSGDVFF